MPYIKPHFDFSLFLKKIGIVHVWMYLKYCLYMYVVNFAFLYFKTLIVITCGRIWFVHQMLEALGLSNVDYFNRGSNDISEFGAIMDECWEVVIFILKTLR